MIYGKVIDFFITENAEPEKALYLYFIHYDISFSL